MRRISGLYVITPQTSDTARLARDVAAAVAGGARAVQYRSKLIDGAARLEQASALMKLCRDRDALFIVNDDIDLALAVEAHGVHLGHGDPPLRTARAKLGTHKLIGASCYDNLQLARDAIASGADYIAFGSVFASRVKPGAVRAPLTLFAQARREWSVPLVAIGGITLDNARSVLDAGADALAVITAVFDAPDVAASARAFAALF